MFRVGRGSAYHVAVKNAIATTVLLLVAVAGVACRSTSPRDAQSQAIPIEQVVADPQSYAHQLVTIRGCFVSSFERVALLPCRNANIDQSIWVEDAEMLHAMQDTRLPAIPPAIPDELRTAPKTTFVFSYDVARTRAAWNKLRPEDSPNPYRAEVVVVGQFETIRPRNPEALKDGFGHMNMYPHELVLTDVIESRPVGLEMSTESAALSGEPVGEGNIGYPMKGFIGYTNTGTPVSGMTIECFTPSGKKVGATKTDAAGMFSFAEMPEGRYKLQAKKPGLYTLTATVNTTRTSSNFLSLVAEAK